MGKRNVRTKKQNDQKPAVSPMLIVGISLAAVLLVVGLIVLGNQSTRADVTVNLNEYPSEGNANAAVTVVEYSDFGCPHCRDFNLEKLDQILADYVDTGKVRYVVHPYYLGNPAIGFATEASLCANDQGAFHDYQRALFKLQGQINYDTATLTEVATSLELDVDQFSQCLGDRKYQQLVEDGRQAAINKGINSTPTFYVNEQRVEGNQPLSVFQQYIDQELSIAQ
jgi:protein-disulfide isomerase